MALPVVHDATGLAGRYKDKVVIVTGGTKGIGEGCVRVFFEAGANVCFCARSESQGVAFQDVLNSRGYPNKAVFVRADVSVNEQVINVINKTVEVFGQIDCLINNAGWHPPCHRLDDFKETDMTDLFQLNFMSYFVACKYALPYLRKTKGNIINMSSLVGVQGQVGATTYAATKGAITSFSKALAVDEAHIPVRVNVVSPGNIWTPLCEAGAKESGDAEKAKKAGEEAQQMLRMGTIEETGRLCLAIAADLTFTTGVDHLQTGGAEIGYGSKCAGSWT